jgi:hypothetical protein
MKPETPNAYLFAVLYEEDELDSDEVDETLAVPFRSSDLISGSSRRPPRLAVAAGQPHL